MYRYALLFLLFASTAFGQDVTLSLKGDGVKVVKVDRVIIVKEDATVVQSFPITITAPTNGGLYFWSYPAGVVAVDRNDVLEISSAPKGQTTVSIKSVTANLDKDGKFIGFKSLTGSITFTVGDVPQPPDPKPPVPPEPPPGPALLPVAGVLMIEKSEDRGTITKGQYNVLFGADVRNLINASVDKENGQPALRIFDINQSLTGQAKHWQDAAARRPKDFTTPWMIISNGVTGWEGPVPMTEAEAKTLLTKYLSAKGVK